MISVNAQQAYESVAQLDKNNSGSCVSMKVTVNAKDAQKVMENLLKAEGLSKGKSSGKKIAYETPILFSAISQQYINLFVSFDEVSKDKNAPVTAVSVFVRKGIDAPFETANSDSGLIANVKGFLEKKYSAALYDFDIALKKEAKRKEIEQTQKTLESLRKQMDGRVKDISNYEKDIEKAKANIEKAKSDTASARLSLENQQRVLIRQQEELNLVK
ncbi:MAG: hypothetical protein LBB85_06755 [Dysgonamonadaceae bacterium]|jgi:hypothetical protein|nr:hypothetical protein [Dysgonamonadaceae bacterium]